MAKKMTIHWYTDDERPDEKELVLIQDKHGDRYQALWIEEVNGWDCGNHGCIDATAIVAWTHLPKYDPTPISLTRTWQVLQAADDAGLISRK